MQTLDEVYNIIQNINEEAHQEAWDDWIAADNEEDDDLAEELREDASNIQKSSFRTLYWQLPEEDRKAVLYWIIKDKDFSEEFKDWYDPDVFDEEIDLE